MYLANDNRVKSYPQEHMNEIAVKIATYAARRYQPDSGCRKWSSSPGYKECWSGTGLVQARVTQSNINPMLPISFPVNGANKWRPDGRELPVARIGQRPWRRPGWTILPICPNTKSARHFRCEDSNVSLRAASPIVREVGGALSPIR